MFVPAFNVVIKDGKIKQVLGMEKPKEEIKTDGDLNTLIKNNNKFINFYKKLSQQIANDSAYMSSRLNDFYQKANSVKDALLIQEKWFYAVEPVKEEGEFMIFDNNYYRKDFMDFLINFINYNLYYVYILSKAKFNNFVLSPKNTLYSIRYADNFDDESKDLYNQSMKILHPVILYTEKIKTISEAMYQIILNGDFSAEKLKNTYDKLNIQVDMNYKTQAFFAASCEFYNELMKLDKKILKEESTLEKIIVYNAIASSFYYFDFENEYKDVFFINAVVKSESYNAEMEITIMSKDNITVKEFYDQIINLDS